MKWFEGDTASAVQTAKAKQTVFLVYITGDDEMSKSMDATWSDETVSKACEDNGWVSLQLKANSEACAQFSAIYPVVCVPCVFFIGSNGMPIEITPGSQEPQQLISIFNKVARQHQSQALPVPQLPVEPKVDPPKEDPPKEDLPREEEAQTSNEASKEVLTAAEQASLDDKVERAKILIEQKREAKARKEMEEMKRKEKERIELGKNLNKLRELKAEQEQKEVMEGWKKEKEEAKAARERVKQQIAQDRAVRAAKTVAAKAENKTALSSNEKKPPVKSDIVRIQFRMSDGTAVTQNFSPNDTLQDAHNFLSQRVPGHSFQLSTAFPKRVFTSNDFSQSLVDLDLAPSALLIVLLGARGATSTSSSDASGIVGFVMMLLGPLFSIWNFLMGFLLGAPPAVNQNAQVPPPRTEDQSEFSNESSQPSTRPKSARGLRSRQEGNIRRMRNPDDSDDDNATWNGNSTQQM